VQWAIPGDKSKSVQGSVQNICSSRLDKNRLGDLEASWASNPQEKTEDPDAEFAGSACIDEIPHLDRRYLYQPTR
jgi:hypothetical protein